MMTFLNPLDALIPKIQFSVVAEFGSGSPLRPGDYGWMDGWCENSGGNSLGHGPKAPISRSPCQQRFLNLGLADPRNLGSCTAELMTCQLLVGNFGQPRPPRTAVERQGIRITEPLGCRGAYRRDEGWVGGERERGIY